MLALLLFAAASAATPPAPPREAPPGEHRLPCHWAQFDQSQMMVVSPPSTIPVGTQLTHVINFARVSANGQVTRSSTSRVEILTAPWLKGKGKVIYDGPYDLNTTCEVIGNWTEPSNLPRGPLKQLPGKTIANPPRVTPKIVPKKVPAPQPGAGRN